MKRIILILISISINFCSGADDSKNLAKPSFSILGIPYVLIPYEMPLDIKHTENGFGEIANSGYTTPHLIETVQASLVPLTILEIGPGDGRVLKQLLTKSTKQPFTYHSVDLSKECRTKINRVINAYGKNSKNKFSIHVGDAFEFLETKTETYNIILMNNVSHYYSPLQQIDLFQKIHTSLKAGGELYTSQCSILSAEIWASDFGSKELNKRFIEYFQSQQLQGDLWPGYIVNGELAEQIRAYTLLCKTQLGKTKKNLGKWDYPTLHSSQTLSDFLSSVGFSISKALDFTEINPSRIKLARTQSVPLPSIKVGIIAQKIDTPNDEALSLYRSAAHFKQTEFELLSTQITATTAPSKSATEKIMKEEALVKINKSIQLFKKVSRDAQDLGSIAFLETLLEEYNKQPSNILYEKMRVITDNLTVKLFMNIKRM